MISLLVAAILLASYLLGSIPCGLLISKSQGLDIREHGSRNIGATNVWRVMGKKWGLLAFVGDTAKGWLAVLLGMWLAARWSVTLDLPHGHILPPDFAGITAALGCILGHTFPVWLRFKGGQGVAPSLGVILGMMPLAALIDLDRGGGGAAGSGDRADVLRPGARLGRGAWVGKFLLRRGGGRARHQTPHGQPPAPPRRDRAARGRAENDWDAGGSEVKTELRNDAGMVSRVRARPSFQFPHLAKFRHSVRPYPLSFAP